MTGSRRVVVGGGVAGLAAAQALHRKGIPALMLESRATLADAGLAVNLPGPGSYRAAYRPLRPPVVT
jgi:2-polyprenyl-6-methoxyphenol hydroxylase-like FAD-dependent oxidoreductase